MIFGPDDLQAALDEYQVSLGAGERKRLEAVYQKFGGGKGDDVNMLEPQKQTLY